MSKLNLSKEEILEAILESPKISDHEKTEVSLQNPLTKLLYNEIIRFSKKELESITDRFKEKDCLYNTLISHNHSNPFLFKALIEKRVSFSLYTKSTKWILKNCKDITSNEYDLIYRLEKENNSYEVFNNFINFLKDKNEDLLSKYFDSVIKKNKNLNFVTDYIFDYLFQEQPNKVVFLLIEKLNNIGVKISDFKINDVLKKELFKTKYYNLEANHTLDISYFACRQIENILKIGCTFDEEKCSKILNKSFYTAVLESKSEKFLMLVLPTLKNIPTGEEININKEIIEQNKDVFKNYEEIKALFEYQVLKKDLNEVMENKKEIRKIKI